MQNYFGSLPLGVRLWRAPDMSSKFDKSDYHEFVHKVFDSYSTAVAQMLQQGKIKLIF